MSKIFKFGDDVEGYTIPVLNEREVRAASGIMYTFMIIAAMIAILSEDFTMLKYFVTAFVLDFAIRVFISPRFSPTMIMGRWIVIRQVPEYVGAPQKKFAWYIGITMGVTMFILLNVMNTVSIITGIFCLFCLIFMLFETAFGICLGCLVYHWVYKKKAQYCPGEVCERRDRHETQKSNWGHVLIVIAYIAFIVAMVILMRETYIIDPTIYD